MFSIFSITAPIFIIIGLGFLIVKIKLIDKGNVGVLGAIVLYLAMPSVILNVFLNTSIRDVIQLNLILVYSLGAFITFFIAFFFCRFVLKKNFSLSALNSFGSAMPNTAFIGYPLLLQAFADPPLAIFSILLLVECIFIIPMCLFMLELGGSIGKGKSVVSIFSGIAKGLAKNPIIISMLLGLLFSLFGLHLPVFLEKSILLLSQAATPIALLFIGATLASTKWQAKLDDVFPVASIKLFIHPIVVILLMLVFPITDAITRHVLVLIASVPMMAMFPILADKYGYRPQAASLLLVTTLLSFFSISLVFLIYPYLPLN